MGDEEAVSYEELRQRKLEENKKKLEELKISHLSLTLRAAAAPKTSPAKPAKRSVPGDGDSVAVRRSDRVAKLPQANYKDQVEASDMFERPRRIFKRRCLSDRVYASDEARLYALTRADEVQSELDPEFPSFVKPMLQSHVTGGFWLGLPTQFCNKYLPKHDTPIALIDENEEESDTLYLAHKKGLSAGWRGFSIAHELVDGDALVFQMIQPTAFKVKNQNILSCSSAKPECRDITANTFAEGTGSEWHKLLPALFFHLS